MTTPRTLPELTQVNEHFWTSGQRGALEVTCCTACEYWVHPPSPVCPKCLSATAPRPVSGRGRVHGFTVNHHPWVPGLEVPYVVAIVELDEQSGLRVTTNVVGCPPDEVTFEMPVEVTFEKDGDVYLPLFQPVGR